MLPSWHLTVISTYAEAKNIGQENTRVQFLSLNMCAANWNDKKNKIARHSEQTPEEALKAATNHPAYPEVG
jgi:hypothetical protein